MIISIVTEFEERHGRAFFCDRAIVPSPEELTRSFGDAYFDDDDTSRDPLLRDLLQNPIVEGVIHPGIDPSDVVHAYLTPPGGDPLFACTIVTEERLALMLTEAPTVFENFSFQVASGPHLTDAALRAAVESWSGRNYPDLAPAQFNLVPWVDEESSDGLDVILTPGATEEVQANILNGTPQQKRLVLDKRIPRPAFSRRAA